MYHSALFVNLGRVESEGVCPVAEYQQARVECRLARGRHVGYVVNGLVDGGVGIEVAAKLHAKRFQVTDKFVAREMLCSVKAHVF